MAHLGDHKNRKNKDILDGREPIYYLLKNCPKFFTHFYLFFNNPRYSKYHTLRAYYCHCALPGTTNKCTCKKFLPYLWMKKKYQKRVKLELANI